MQIFATFEYSPLLELAISELKARDVGEIYAVPLALRNEDPRILDTIHRSDGVSYIDKGFILAFLLATIGASKGFVWEWGPVIWGLIGAASGIVLGLAISWCQIAYKRRRTRLRIRKGTKGDVILIVTCDEGQVHVAKDILWDHQAIGLAVTE
ncbi:hypothetical protein FE782_16185 [Paenibacillus antri]|uniref:Uncharacterized protein n=1 Tax=Paenibacillus antri TaxID=2582848 RepID=A0A5R9GD19_9BACL|nr:hypothetical protein FE782_16185 [Paenibacillus antri]